MSDSDVESTANSDTKIPRFHGKRGEDYGLWRLRLRAVCRIKGVWNVVETSPSDSYTSDITAGNTADSARRIAKMEKASGIIICALGNSPLRVIDV